MRAVKVQYTVKSEYAETNAANIRKVMADLQQLKNDAIKYSTFILEDKKTFIHFAMVKNEFANAVLNELESFKIFQNELKASMPEVPPKLETLSLVGSSYEIFE